MNSEAFKQPHGQADRDRTDGRCTAKRGPTQGGRHEAHRRQADVGIDQDGGVTIWLSAHSATAINAALGTLWPPPRPLLSLVALRERSSALQQMRYPPLGMHRTAQTRPR